VKKKAGERGGKRGCCRRENPKDSIGQTPPPGGLRWGIHVQDINREFSLPMERRKGAEVSAKRREKKTDPGKHRWSAKSERSG